MDSDNPIPQGDPAHETNPVIHRPAPELSPANGGLYNAGGASANLHQSAGIILAPIRLGAGLVKYTREKTWNPLRDRFRSVMTDDKPGPGRRLYGYRHYGF